MINFGIVMSLAFTFKSQKSKYYKRMQSKRTYLVYYDQINPFFVS